MIKHPNPSARVRRTRGTTAYDVWFKQQVQQALDEPGPGIPHEQVEAKFAAKRKALSERLARR